MTDGYIYAGCAVILVALVMMLVAWCDRMGTDNQ